MWDQPVKIAYLITELEMYDVDRKYSLTINTWSPEFPDVPWPFMESEYYTIRRGIGGITATCLAVFLLRCPER